jgi:CubicO group peptidase (beta-lactamase class C family)
MTMRKILLLSVLFISFIGFSQQTKFQKIDSLLTFLNANNKFMGSIALRENDKIVFAKTYGYADVESNKKLETNTKLKIGSITKTFTATIIMQLIDEKKLTLDTKLSVFYPQIPNAEKITIHHLLHHRTGIPDFLNDDPNSSDYIFIENKKEDIISRIAAYESAFEPNSKFKYSNSNYNLLGYIIEDVTKKSFSDNLNDRIVKRLGLKNTYFPLKTDLAKNESFSFVFDGKAWEKSPEWSSSLAYSAGAMCSTPSDLTAFMNGLFSGKLVSKEALEQMKTMEEGYGKGIIIAPFKEKKFYSHTGGIENFRAVVGYNEEEQFGISLIVNGDNFNRNDIMIGVLSLYYQMPYNFPNVKDFAVSKEVLAKYIGTYSSPTFPMKVTITEENGVLFAQATGQSSFPLSAKSETEFVFLAAGIKIVFAENQLTLKQGAEYVLKKE